MVTIEQAFNTIKETQIASEIIEIPISKSLRRVLAEDLFATIDTPNFDNAAMDGYVVGELSTSYVVVGKIQAGDINEYHLKKGECYRIYTGAKVPKNAFAVVQQEICEVNEKKMTILQEIKNGQNIRLKGEQLKKGEVIAKKNSELNPGLIGFIAQFGITKLKVFKHPSISILVTGDELKEPEESLKAGEIYESNAITLQNAALDYGFRIKDKIKVKDTLEDTKKQMLEALTNHDIVLFSGGISVGDYDFVRPAFLEIGGTEIFYKVHQKPGKPLFFGEYKVGDQTKYLFGLPGNPSSALTCFYLYVLPLLRKSIGLNNMFLTNTKAYLATSFNKSFDRPVFLKGSYEHNGQVTILGKQQSSMLHSYMHTNALVYLDEGVKNYDENEKVKVILI